MTEVLPTPVKSLSDKKDYRTIRLSNGLTALLISDMSSLKEGSEDKREQIFDDDHDMTTIDESESEEDSDEEIEDELTDSSDEHEGRQTTDETHYQAAASLCISAGGFEDPFSVPGLMHFLEHMVFMGSKKYPKENYFDSFTRKNGGDNNAHTDLENTTFYFGVQEEYFKKSLDIFAQFFIHPLMKKDAMTRERESVHSEFQLIKQDDGERAEQLFSTMAVEGHPMTKFLCGNEKTLNLDISKDELNKKLHEIRSRFYSAQYMTLAVQARERLDTLQDWVTEIFSEVPNNCVGLLSYKDLAFPFPKERIHHLYKVIPVKEFHSIEITWVLPSQQSRYKYKPLNYLSHLIGDEGVGSILSYLKKRDWSIGLQAGNSGSGYEDNTTCSIFSIAISLTDEGFKNIGEVLLVVFQYLKLLQKTGPLDWVFKELQSIEQINFDYETECSPIENVEDLSENMRHYPSEHFLTGDSLLFEYNSKMIEECLSALKADSCNIMIFSKEYKDLGICNLTEKWYGTTYSIEEIPTEWKERWMTTSLNPELQIPEPNKFIPNDFSLHSGTESSGEYPQKILQKDFGELWFKQDDKFMLPRGFCYIWFRMERVKSSARMCAFLELFLSLLQQQIQEKIYPAAMAKYSCRVVPSFPGFSMKLSGFNQKLEMCLILLLSQISVFPSLLQESTFEQMKNQQLKAYHNATINPTIMRKDVRLSILEESHWHSAEKLKAVQIATMDEFLQEFANNMLSCCDIRMLVQGNMSISGATHLFSLVSEARKSNISSPCAELRTRRLPGGNWCARIMNINKSDVNSSVINYYQAGVGTIWNELLSEFLIMVMDEPAYDFLRTQEQLGYCVYCTNRNTNGILGLSITVDSQADKFSVDHVNEKIEEFLKMILQQLKDMPSKEFSNHLETLKKMKLTIDLTLGEEVARNWSEIEGAEYIFDRLTKQVEMISKIKHSDVVSWLEKIILSSSSDFRKLSVQVVGSCDVKDKTPPSLDDTINQPIEKLICLSIAEAKQNTDGKDQRFINNLESFKSQLELLPITKIVS